MRARPTIALALALLAGAGCGQRDEAESAAAPAEAPASEATPPATGAAGEATPAAPARPVRVGTIRGVLRLAEGAELPSYTAAELGSVPGGGGSCPPRSQADAEPVKLGEGRSLGGVLVSATGDPAAFFAEVAPREATERRVAIDDCRFTPRLVVGVRGDRLVLQNQTQQPMFPVVGQVSYADSLAFGATRAFDLDRAGREVLTCAVPPFCGRADVIVVMNPVFTVSGEGGRFELTNVPADQPITIHAWHPLFREARAEARVTAGGEATVDLVLEPRPSPPPAAPAPTR